MEKPENRKTVTVAMNLLYGAAVVTRVSWLRSQGVVLPAGAGNFTPLELPKILELMNS
jgi:trans-AT polyketide synthase/acyltransferase/oxidoreductase domain-containing protein